MLCCLNSVSWSQTTLPTEDNYYKIVKIPVPEGIIFEVGGIANMPNGDLAVCTRRGEVWMIENPSSNTPTFHKFATGLHEPLGIAIKNGNVYCAQRGELTLLIDRNGDGIADRYETVYKWPISGHYHEYSYGPKIAPDGSFWVTGNVGFGPTDWWYGHSFVPWRGWAMQITEDGKMTPWAAGMRSPCGIGTIDGDLFYGDNQGDWMGSGFISHVEKGDFMGHPASLEWAVRPESPVKVRKEMIFSKVNPRNDPYVKPEYIKDEPMTTIHEMNKKSFPNMGIKSPAVWLPHGILGVSTSEIVKEETNGAFGPFAGQVFVGDQGMSKIARVFLEKVNGEYQGASFDFRSNFRSGVLRMVWGKDNSLYVGGTNRGWGSTGKEIFGFERLMWTGKTPFEMKAVRAMPDGFEIEFTMPVNKATAENVENYTTTSYAYKYHPVYGSPAVNFKEIAVRGAKVSADGLRVRLVVDDLREGYVHDIKPEGVRSENGNLSVLHPQAFYTLNNIPTGPKADIKLVTVKKKNVQLDDKGTKVNTPDNQTKEAAPAEGANTAPKAKTTKVATTAINEKEVMNLLTKNTCMACHKKDERAVGPSFSEIAKRKYTTAQIVALVAEPKPQNWPDYETPMAALPNVPKKEVEKIAAWINALQK